MHEKDKIDRSNRQSYNTKNRKYCKVRNQVNSVRNTTKKCVEVALKNNKIPVRNGKRQEYTDEQKCRKKRRFYAYVFRQKKKNVHDFALKKEKSERRMLTPSHFFPNPNSHLLSGQPYCPDSRNCRQPCIILLSWHLHRQSGLFLGIPAPLKCP